MHRSILAESKMYREFYFILASGLAFVGVALFLLGCIIKESGASQPKKNDNSTAFRLMRGGAVVAGASGVLYIVLLVIPEFEQFPPEGLILRLGQVSELELEMPWGAIRVLPAALSLIVTLLMSSLGVGLWVHYRAYFGAALCWLIGLAMAFWGMTQWT